MKKDWIQQLEEYLVFLADFFAISFVSRQEKHSCTTRVKYYYSFEHSSL